jgi:hypothetical protein
MMRSVPTVVVVFAVWLVGDLRAHDGPPPAGDACPQRGVKEVGPTSIATDQGVSCSGGIPFTFNGVPYPASSSLCPSAVTYHPVHYVPDPTSFFPCMYPKKDGTTYDVTKQDYRCVVYIPPFGCGFLGLGQCCEPDGEPVVTNTFPNWTWGLCEPCPKPGGGS